MDNEVWAVLIGNTLLRQLLLRDHYYDHSEAGLAGSRYVALQVISHIHASRRIHAGEACRFQIDGRIRFTFSEDGRKHDRLEVFCEPVSFHPIRDLTRGDDVADNAQDVPPPEQLLHHFTAVIDHHTPAHGLAELEGQLHAQRTDLLWGKVRSQPACPQLRL